MNFEYFLYQYLLKHNTAEVPGFGVFELTKQSAKIDAENSIIIPPKETVSFQHKETVFDNHLAKYIATETNSNLFLVQTDLKNEVANWIQKLQNNQILSLDNLGQFQLGEDKKIIKMNDDNSGVFGFEEVDLLHLKTLKSKKIFSEDYSFNKNVIWTFLSLIILGSASLFLFGNQELIFGKSSQIPTKKVARKILQPKVLATPKQDSIKTDSLKTTTNAEVQKSKR